MLTSLFGDLGKPRDFAPTGADPAPDGGFAATALMESVATEVNERGQMVDRHTRDLVVSGSPAHAIREHFAATRADLETASRLITLLDPTGVWASSVLKALSDAGGQPIERLHLREQGTLRTLAMIERTTLVRRHEDTLKIYHADVRVPGRDSAEIPVALMERSHMTTVIIGSLAPHAIDALLQSLVEAARLPTWRCPNLLFMLPPGAVWIANKISAIPWPESLYVHVLSEPLVSASSVWNAMLGVWNRVRSQPGWSPEASAPVSARDSARADQATGMAPAVATPAVMRITRNLLDTALARQALAEVATLEGMLGCAVVDSSTGLVLARESREDLPLDLDLASAASAQVLRAHRMAARNMGLSEHIDEIMTSAGARHQLIRTLTQHPELFIVALLDKHRCNLALARYKLAEIEKSLP